MIYIPSFYSHYFTDKFACLGCVDELETLFHDSLSIYKSNEVEVIRIFVLQYFIGP
jgi:N-terminal acetyltransferase B complex non-catalytic subunit